MCRWLTVLVVVLITSFYVHLVVAVAFAFEVFVIFGKSVVDCEHLTLALVISAVIFVIFFVVVVAVGLGGVHELERFVYLLLFVLFTFF